MSATATSTIKIQEYLATQGIVPQKITLEEDHLKYTKHTVYSADEKVFTCLEWLGESPGFTLLAADMSIIDET